MIRLIATGSSRTDQTGRSRAAATLTEVLMSLLVMGIGVVSVFTLFPISVLRSIQATQQTNSKILKLNAESLLQAAPDFLNTHTPAGGVNVAPRIRGQWQPRTEYFVGDVVVPSGSPGNPYASSARWFVCTAADPDSFSNLVEPAWAFGGQNVIDIDEQDPNGNSMVDPAEDTNGTLPGDTSHDRIAWRSVPAPMAGGLPPIIALEIQPDGSVSSTPTNSPPTAPATTGFRYIVDPLGWNVYGADDNTWFNEFGVIADRRSGGAVRVPGISTLLRMNGGIVDRLDTNSDGILDTWRNTPRESFASTSLGDFWEVVVEATPATATPTSIDFSNTVDVSGIVVGSSRITVTSADGSMTVTRQITNLNIPTETVEWATQFPLPARFPVDASGNPDVGLASIEVFDRRYTWFLTVKKDVEGNQDVKVVVVFNRSFLPADEHTYAAVFGNTNIDHDTDGNADVNNGSQVRIFWGGLGGTAVSDPDPLLKPGNFLLDRRTVEWYRIQNVVEGTNTALLTLDRSTISTPDDGSGALAPAMPIGQAILMPGIIDVYDL